MTKIKICGITRLDDAHVAAECGADYLGFLFVRTSRRYIEPEHAAEIVASTKGPKFVGVFQDENVSTMNRIASVVGLDYVQLHGSESDEDIRALNVPAIKTFIVGDTLPAISSAAEMLLLDSGGGSGKRFDWSLLAKWRTGNPACPPVGEEQGTGRIACPPLKPFFLAGGITPDNAAAAISKVRPDAIDVSSGVEITPGVKSPAKLRELFARVKGA